MTEAEADALDELLTRTTPKINPAVRGITARRDYPVFACEPVPAYPAGGESGLSQRQPQEAAAGGGYR